MTPHPAPRNGATPIERLLHFGGEYWGRRLDARYASAFLAWLEALGGARVVGSLDGGAALVRDGYPGRYRLWAIADNGGELNVEVVNDPASLRSVAYTVWQRPVNAATLAYRVHAAMRSLPIDYELLWDDFGFDEPPYGYRGAA